MRTLAQIPRGKTLILMGLSANISKKTDAFPLRDLKDHPADRLPVSNAKGIAKQP